MFKGSANLKENEFIPQILNSGGVCNAFTFQDATVYYERMPSNQIEKALWMESDRMISLQFGKETFETEKKVVLEEKLQRYDNAPYGTVFYNIFKNIFPQSLYEHIVIGNENDIKNFTLEGAAKFHENYYAPDNAALIVTGDFEVENMKELINKYYKDINKKIATKRKENVIQQYKGYKKIVVEDNITLPKIYLSYQVTGLKDDAQYPLEFIEVLLAGNKSSRLYKKLVYEKKLLKSVVSYRYLLGDAGIFIVEGTLLEDSDIDQIEEMIADELENFKDSSLSDKEIQKVKNETEQKQYSSFVSEQNIALSTMYNWLYYKDTSRINTEIERTLNVEKKDIIEIASRFFKKENRLTMNYIPKA